MNVFKYRYDQSAIISPHFLTAIPQITDNKCLKQANKQKTQMIHGVQIKHVGNIQLLDRSRSTVLIAVHQNPTFTVVLWTWAFMGEDAFSYHRPGSSANESVCRHLVVKLRKHSHCTRTEPLHPPCVNLPHSSVCTRLCRPEPFICNIFNELFTCQFSI